MSLLDRPSIARSLGFGDDGPVRPDGRWTPENGRELYFHAHLQEPWPGTTDAEDDVAALALLQQISALDDLDDVAVVAALVEASAAINLPVDRYVIEPDGSARHIVVDPPAA